MFAVWMMIEQRCGQGGAYGGAPWHCFGRRTSDEKTNNQKYGVTLDGRRLMMTHTTTNQKHASATERDYKRRCDQGGARRGDDTIVLGGIRS
jgi:hypothetical protein